jgi:hypothetical protein
MGSPRAVGNRQLIEGLGVVEMTVNIDKIDQLAYIKHLPLCEKGIKKICAFIEKLGGTVINPAIGQRLEISEDGDKMQFSITFQFRLSQLEENICKCQSKGECNET